MSQYHLNYLEQLEAESIQIFREVAAQFEKPALLFSGGKDSIVMVHLAKKAFAPGKIPFPLVHIDTGHNFPEALAFRDKLADEVQATLIVRKVEDTIRQKNLTEPKGKFPSRNWLQTYTLLDAIEEFKFDCSEIMSLCWAARNFIVVKGVLISWATPAAISPRADIFSILRMRA